MGRYKVDPITGELTLMNPSMSDIPIYQGVSGSTASVSGLVPQAQAGDEEKALLGNGTWGTVAGGGQTISYADWLQLTPEEQTHGEYFIPDYSGSILPTGGFDNVPTAGSQNPVTSNGIYESITTTNEMIANIESFTTSTHAYTIGQQFILNGVLHIATAAIAVGDTLIVGTNCAVNANLTEQIRAIIENPHNRNFYGTCPTAAATAAKVVTVSDSSFKLEIGTTVTIKFTNTNTASNPTINVNSTGAIMPQ